MCRSRELDRAANSRAESAILTDLATKGTYQLQYFNPINASCCVATVSPHRVVEAASYYIIISLKCKKPRWQKSTLAVTKVMILDSL